MKEFTPLARQQLPLRPIESSSFGDAVGLLHRGFPATSRDFWTRAMQRQAALQADGFGYFLESKGQPVGIMLTLRSERTRSDGTTYPVVNLSSWYVEPAHRWRAVMMLSTIIGQSEGLITDLTAASSLYKMMEATGFSSWSSGVIVASAVPWAALPAGRGAKVLGLDRAGAFIDPGDAAMLDWHARDGLTSAVLCDETGYCPIIFRLISRKGIRFAQLVYAKSRKTVIRNLPVVTRFLAARGILFVLIDAHRVDCPAGAVFRGGRQRFWRGAVDGDRLDYAYSELVLFGVS